MINNRIIDANLNRLREGIRVLEDIYRFVLNNKEIALKLKNLRHLCRTDNYEELLKSRDIINDSLKESTESELKRDNIKDILIANFKRGEESARVLEEIFKIQDIKLSDKYKKIRYSLYNLEKSNI